MITVETATVYRAGGRRFFTAKAAAESAARAKIKAKCAAEFMCDYCDHPEMPGAPTEDLPCHFHDGSAYGQKAQRRLARLYMHAFRAERATTQTERQKP